MTKVKADYHPTEELLHCISHALAAFFSLVGCLLLLEKSLQSSDWQVTGFWCQFIFIVPVLELVSRQQPSTAKSSVA